MRHSKRLERSCRRRRLDSTAIRTLRSAAAAAATATTTATTTTTVCGWSLVDEELDTRVFGRVFALWTLATSHDTEDDDVDDDDDDRREVTAL